MKSGLFNRTVLTFAGILALDALLVILHMQLSAQYSFVDLDAEHNLPATYQGVKLLVVGILALLHLSLLYYFRRPLSRFDRFLWYIFAALFLFLGLDEIMMIHEKVNNFFLKVSPESSGSYTQMFVDQGFDSSPWLLYYLPLFAIAGVLMLTFMYRLRKKYKRELVWIMLGIVCFACVPIAELIGTDGDWLTLTEYKQIVIVEEGLEMLGGSFFLFFVLKFLREDLRLINNFGSLRK